MSLCALIIRPSAVRVTFVIFSSLRKANNREFLLRRVTLAIVDNGKGKELLEALCQLEHSKVETGMMKNDELCAF
jgi:hypothetical protein